MSHRRQAVILITGIQASGKSTIAQLLAERLPASAHVRGDTFRRMLVNGRAEMSANPDDEAIRQLRLRYQLTAQAADTYFAAGFTAIVQDVILGDHLGEMIETIGSRPLFVVVLAPNIESVMAREAQRSKNAYDTWTVAALDTALRQQTPKIGLWLDTSTQTQLDTVDEILASVWNEGLVLDG